MNLDFKVVEFEVSVVDNEESSELYNVWKTLCKYIEPNGSILNGLVMNNLYNAYSNFRIQLRPMDEGSKSFKGYATSAKTGMSNLLLNEPPILYLDFMELIYQLYTPVSIKYLLFYDNQSYIDTNDAEYAKDSILKLKSYNDYYTSIFRDYRKRLRFIPMSMNYSPEFNLIESSINI